LCSGGGKRPLPEGERALAPRRALGTPLQGLSGPQAFVAWQSSTDALYPPGRLYYWKSLFVQDLSHDLLAAAIDRAAARPSSFSQVILWRLGGAMNRRHPQVTAFGQREAGHMLSLDSAWNDPRDTGANLAWTQGFWRAAQRFASEGPYLNFLGLGEEAGDLVRQAHGLNYERLVRLKRQYDPSNLFRFNQNISPEVTL
jgi:FAD/FMN-containing dehydrogenase